MILQRLNETAEEVRSKTAENDDREKDRGRRSASQGFRRAASTESDSGADSVVAGKRTAGPQRKPSLYRKSLSLSETAGPAVQDQVRESVSQLAMRLKIRPKRGGKKSSTKKGKDMQATVQGQGRRATMGVAEKDVRMPVATHVNRP